MTGKLAVGPHPRNGPGGGPGDYDILVLDASMKQSLASVRSLGRAGLRVAAGESIAQLDPAIPVPALRSRYCQRSLVLPDLVNDTPAFIAAVTEFVRDHAPRVVLPTGDVTIGVLRCHREELAELGCVLALAPEAALDIANDKDLTLTLAEQLSIAQPKSLRIAGEDDLAAAVTEFGFPFVLKPTISWTGGTVDRLVPVDVINLDEATEVTERFLNAGAGVLAQQWVPGRREGVSLFIAGDEVVAACGHVAHRTTPPLGGASAVRESIEVPDDTMHASVLLAKAIGLQGVCEVEFRRDAENRPLLMEINARLAGTIENAVRSGVDFPLMIWNLATGQDVVPVTSHRCGVRTRWLHGDMRWLRQNWQRRGRPDGMSHSRIIYTFIAEFAKSRHYDYFDRRDIRPFLAELRYTVHVLRKP
ncbi:MAG TPA: ATP-grasp domain-containing protein [Trebonia sp.]|nr:ATP-grasp domain-containing protein [Trebonia sp.]